MAIVTLSIPQEDGPPKLVDVPVDVLVEMAGGITEKNRRYFGETLRVIADGGNARHSARLTSVGFPLLPAQVSRGAMAEGAVEAQAPTATEAEPEHASLVAARLYWSGKVADLDDKMAPLRQEEQELKDQILTTHGPVDRMLLDPARRATRARLFTAMMALQPQLGPLRQKRRDAYREAKSLDLRIKAEEALKARAAKRSQKRKTRNG